MYIYIYIFLDSFGVMVGIKPSEEFIIECTIDYCSQPFVADDINFCWVDENMNCGQRYNGIANQLNSVQNRRRRDTNDDAPFSGINKHYNLLLFKFLFSELITTLQVTHPCSTISEDNPEFCTNQGCWNQQNCRRDQKIEAISTTTSSCGKNFISAIYLLFSLYYL